MTYRDELESVRAQNRKLEEALAEARAAHAAPAPVGPATRGAGRPWTVWRVVGLLFPLAILGLLFGVAIYAGWQQAEREKAMTHVATAAWPARVRRAEGLYVPSDASCLLSARLRTDGRSRSDASVVIRCGSLTLYDRHIGGKDEDQSAFCDVGEEGTGPARRFRLRCEYPEVWSKGTVTTPALHVDTAAKTVVLTSSKPPSHVELDVDPLSNPSPGPRLWDAR